MINRDIICYRKSISSEIHPPQRNKSRTNWFRRPRRRAGRRGERGAGWGAVLRQKSSIPPAASASAVAVGRRGAANRWCLKLHQSLWEKVDCATKKIKFPAEKCSKTALMLVFRSSRRWFSVGFQYFSKGTGEFSKLPLIDRV